MRFILGRAGSGKTWHALERVRGWSRERGAGGRSFLIVPSQASFSTQRLLACSGGGAVVGCRVVSFEKLAGELSPELDGAGVAVSSQGRRMIVAQVLRQHAGELRYFRNSQNQPNLAARLDRTLRELESERVTLEEIERVLCAGAAQGEGLGEQGHGYRRDGDCCTRDACATLEASVKMTADKLHDLRVIAAGYEAYLGRERIDPLKRLERLEKRIAESDLVADTLVVVDGFAGFTAIQMRLLVALAQRCGEMDLCLLLDPDQPLPIKAKELGEDLGMFARTRWTYARVYQAMADVGVKILPPLKLQEQHRLRGGVLAHVERNFDAETPAAYAGDARKALQIVEATGIEHEVVTAARHVKGWLMEGVRAREIGVLVRNLEGYHGIIRRVFAEHGIPCFVDRRRALAAHPLVRYLQAVLAIVARGVARGFRQDAVVELLKSGLSGLSVEEAAFLENFALKHGVDGEAWTQEKPWAITGSLAAEDGGDEDGDDEALANAKAEALRRRVVEPLKRLGRALNASAAMRDRVMALYELMGAKGHDVRGSLAKWMRELEAQRDAEGAQEHKEAWGQVMSLLDDAVALVGDEKMEVAEFVQTMVAGLEEMDLALTPPTLDQVVVGQVDRSRSPEMRCAVVLGMNEGLFPAGFTEDAIFSDAERRLLAANDVNLAADTSQQTLGEILLAYVALTRASERVVLLRPRTNEAGKETAASSILSRLRRMVPGLPVTVAPAHGVETIYTPAQLAVALVKHHRSAMAEEKETASGVTEGATGETPVPRGEDVYAQLTHYVQGESSPVTEAARGALRARMFANDAKLSPTLVKEMLGSTLTASVSRLEAFAACPFKHFAQYMLKLREREVAEISDLDLGNAYHFVLEQLARQVIDERAKWATLGDGDIDQLADQVAGELRSQLLLSNARNRYLLEHIKKTLRRVLRDQKIMEESNVFTTLGAELAFGSEGAELGAMRLSVPGGGETLLLRGKIDRVDWVEEQLKVAVYDYKKRGKKLELKYVLNGLSLQLLTYLLVLEQQGASLTGGRKLTAAGAFYVGLLRSMESAKQAPTEPPPEDEVESKPEGVFRAEDVGLFDRKMESSRTSKVLKAKLTKDGAVAKSSQAYTPEEFDALLEKVRENLGRLARQIFDGSIKVEPYLMKGVTPCSYCDYRSLCRIDPRLNRYNVIRQTKEAELRKTLVALDGQEGKA